MINKNCTRVKFSERFKGIVDRYNAGGSENEDYYEQLIKLLEEMQAEQKRADTEGLSEEELEVYDLLIKGKKLTKAEEQKVKLAAKNLYKKLMEEKATLMIVDWYKDDQPTERVKNAIKESLNINLPECYDKDSFNAKTVLLLNHFIDMAVQGYGWVAASA
jgi:type I restriction enzyme R subunit